MSVSKKYKPSEELEDFLGSSRKVTRGEVIKAIWDYAKENGLDNMGAIETDEELEDIIGRGTVSAPEIMKRIGDHLI